MDRDQQALFDIVESIELIQEYVQTIDWRNVKSKDYDAVIRRLTIIGEATKRLSTDFRAAHSEIPWKSMAGLRDIIVHEYDVINPEIVQGVVEFELPKLFPILKGLLF